MEKIDTLNDVFYFYPKSTNHSIFISKKDKVEICDLSSNCTKLNFSINKNKMNNESIFNNKLDNNKLDNNKLDNNKIDNNKIDNFTCVYSNNYKLFKLPILQNYNIILLFLVIILFIVLVFHSKK
jgi:hypothetical protein